MEPKTRPRAIFALEDFRLLREALAHYLRAAPDDRDSVKAAALYHRLGRVD
jgi:hypothetical protein